MFFFTFFKINLIIIKFLDTLYIFEKTLPGKITIGCST